MKGVIVGEVGEEELGRNNDWVRKKEWGRLRPKE